jgi:hypothetical protein
MQLSHHKSSHSAEVSQTWSAGCFGGISTSSKTAAYLLMNHVPEQLPHLHLVDHVHYFSNLKPVDESPVQSSACPYPISKVSYYFIH